MIAKGFKSVIWVATVGTAALCCYMVSLKVAGERAELAKVERQIIAAKQDIRSLHTELGTRGRLSQLEHWNAEVLALSAPTAAQFGESGLTLARFVRTEPTLDDTAAEVRMAAAEAPSPTKAAPPVVQAAAPPPATAPVVRQAAFTAPGPKAAPNSAAAETATPAVPAAPAAARKALAAASASAPKEKAEAKPAAEKPRASKLDAKLAADLEAAAGAQGSGGN
jgi:hypothetical protein